MGNIIDYLLWRGDILITKEQPFNEVDSMIMARLSYLLFDKLKLKDVITIEDAAKRMEAFPEEDFLNVNDKEFITCLGKSDRFKKMEVTDYIKVADKEAQKQFGAATIHLSKKEMYISYMGTDSTINGWKEDFNMAFMDNVPCQISGSEYLAKISHKYPHKKIRVGGHSKGGNVAIYAAITSAPSIQDRIIKVYNYDGPGFNKNITDKYENKDIIKKIETYIPQESVIGKTLDHKEKVTTVLSRRGLLGHDIYSWEILGKDIIKSLGTTNISIDIDKTITDWLSNTTIEQRKIFIDTIFEILNSTDLDTFNELPKNLKDTIPKILKKYSEISSDEKKTISEMIRILITSNISTLKERGYTKLGSMKEEYLNIGREKIREFDEKYLSKIIKEERKENAKTN